MARLNASEFEQLIRALAASSSLARLQEQLLRSHAIVSRRKLGSVEALARQLYQLTMGLERDSVPTQVVLALWEEMLRGKLEETPAKELEEIAERINKCLTTTFDVEPGREPELRQALVDYRGALESRVGEPAATLTMLTRAVPSVARIIRESRDAGTPPD